MTDTTSTTTNGPSTTPGGVVTTTTIAPKQGDPAPVDKPLGENGEKALKAEREARAAAERDKAALQKQLDDINAANLTDLEKAQKAARDAEDAAAKAAAEALRWRVAAKHGISDEDAELFLTGTDQAALEAQAARLAERASTAPKPDRSQGGTGSSDQTLNSDPLLNDLKAKLGIA